MSLTVTFPTQLPSQSSVNVIMALSLRLNQCFAHFPCRLLSGPLKRQLSDIYLTASLGDGSFGKTEAGRVTFFQNVRNLMQIQKWQKKIRKKVLFLR